MYSIFADGSLIYSPLASANNQYIATSPRLTVEINKAGSLEFTIPQTNPMYNSYSKLKTIITVEENGREIFRGRVLNDKKDLYLNKSLVCEGQLAFLNDGLVRPYDFSGGTTIGQYYSFLINDCYSQFAEPYRQIKPGNVTAVNAGTQIKVKTEDPNSVYGELSNNLVGAIGGYLQFRRVDGVSYLDWLDSLSKRSNQIIQFGKNMIDFEEYIDASDIYTVMYPVGKKGENGQRVGIASVNNGKDWIQSDTAISLYGHIAKSVAWEDTEDPELLLSQAQNLMSKVIQLATTITINAVDLHKLDVNTDAIECGDFVRVISRPHGIDADFLCSKIIMDLDEPDQTQYTFGLVFNAMTDRQVANKKLAGSSYDLSKNTADSVNAMQTEQYKNFVSKAEFTSKIDDLNKRIDAISPQDLSAYLKKSDADKAYATLTGLKAATDDIATLKQTVEDHEKRITALENK